ncbi:MAG: LptF/LptG family permease [Planctomycetota bacterium]|nr:LptF/LptG family permease [Planctomycetota bacterium]
MTILHRYVLRQLIWVFALTLLSLTGMLVIVGVIGEASKNGLGPQQIRDILPYVVPSLLPFTIPATFLLTVCVVYGRLAGDNEITAIKAAGINVMSVLWPAYIAAAVLSLGTFWLTDQVIPWARSNVERVILTAMEDIFLGILKEKNHFSDPDRGIAISVRAIEGSKLIEPHFRYKLPGSPNTVNITAREATLQFDLEQQHVMLSLVEGQVVLPGGDQANVADEQYPFPLPIRSKAPPPRDLPISQLRSGMRLCRTERESLDRRQVITMAFALSHGDFGELSLKKQDLHTQKSNEATERYRKLYTEIHSRLALACSCFFFALVGSPFAVLQGRRQFLTSFALCFIPILIIYYPIVLVMMNLGKDAVIDPAIGMWIGNLGMGGAAWFLLKRVLKH